jgi:hypothetical protein
MSLVLLWIRRPGLFRAVAESVCMCVGSDGQRHILARGRDGLATRTDSRVLTVSFHDLTLVRFEHAAKRHVAQIGEEICVR